MNKQDFANEKKPSIHVEKKVVIAVSSRALFDLEKENDIFIHKGMEAYYEYQVKNEAKILKPGGGFPLVKALLNFGSEHKQKHKEKESLIEVIIISKNSPEAGIRIFNSINHYKLHITRAAFLGGESPANYLGAFNTDLYLSKESENVKEALKNKVASAKISDLEREGVDHKEIENKSLSEIRIAFDADKVVFSDESEKIFEQQGTEAFYKYEHEMAKKNLADGPFAKFVRALASIKAMYPMGKCPIKLAIVTARNSPAHERVLRTLRAWRVDLDKAFFLGGLSKADVLQRFKPHIFFDDKKENVESSSKTSPSGLVG